MTIRKTKTRTNLTIEIKLKDKLTKIAKEKDISFNALVIDILKDYMKKREDN